eukprot:GHVU01131018.1.p1 GENE.GHVU01131018.1~~GHVU01131018.1.p1  ORF type:complete len:155 (-),score=1.96 GHVU01131018.1:107-571(-)
MTMLFGDARACLVVRVSCAHLAICELNVFVSSPFRDCSSLLPPFLFFCHDRCSLLVPAVFSLSLSLALSLSLSLARSLSHAAIPFPFPRYFLPSRSTVHTVVAAWPHGHLHGYAGTRVRGGGVVVVVAAASIGAVVVGSVSQSVSESVSHLAAL